MWFFFCKLVSLQCIDRCIVKEVNTYRKNKEFSPVNSCCEIVVIGFSSRILTKQITNISNVRDIFEVKSRKTKRPVTILPLPNACCPPSCFFTLGSLLSLRAFPSPCGQGTSFLQKPIPARSKSILRDLQTQGLPFTSGHVGPTQAALIYLLAEFGILKCFDPLLINKE